MRRKDREIADIKAVEEIINRASVCRIAMSTGDMPYIVPVNFGFKDNCLYIHSAKTGKKIEILKKNSNVCFEFDIDRELKKGDRPCDWGMKYRSVIGFGKVKFLKDPEEKKKALNIIMKKYSAQSSFDYLSGAVDGLAVIKVEIKEMSGKSAGYE